MKEQTDITDQQLRALLQKRMLEADEHDPLAEQLLEAEAKLAFGTAVFVAPSAEKEKQLLKKKIKYTDRFKKWWVAGATVLTVAAAILICKLITTSSEKTTAPQEKNNSTGKTDTAVTPTNASPPAIEIKTTDTTKTILNKDPEGKIQLIKNILKENADCSHAIYVTDSILFSPHSPVGSGNELEIKAHAPDDPMYFEEEHNTVWYKYVVPANGQLTFDIIPVDQNNDYDFMLYKWDGGDFRSKILNDKIKPVRACISRNDKKLQGMTGLKTDPELPSFIHSGEGASYVRFIDVSKYDVFYLLVDNVYPHGNGHTVKFHLQTFAPDELHVGQKIVFQRITFLDGDIKFRKGSEQELDSLYRFLVHYPYVKIEIDGHTNEGVYEKLINGVPVNAMELSRLRAKTINEYLVKRGIDPDRLTTKGYGSSQNLFRHPKTIKQNIMNVRAEIVIISLSYHKETNVSGIAGKK